MRSQRNAASTKSIRVGHLHYSSWIYCPTNLNPPFFHGVMNWKYKIGKFYPRCCTVMKGFGENEILTGPCQMSWQNFNQKVAGFIYRHCRPWLRVTCLRLEVIWFSTNPVSSTKLLGRYSSRLNLVAVIQFVPLWKIGPNRRDLSLNIPRL